MIVHDVAQRTPEWFALRLGRLTGSAAGDMMATIKSGEAAARRNLRVRLVLERLTGVSEENGYQSEDMRRGIELEDEALAAYEAATGRLVRQVGFMQHDTLAAGFSPDGLIVGGGFIEVKVPKSATHLSYLRGTIPAEYRYQCIHGLWLTKEPFADLVSYGPSFPPSLRLSIVRLTITEAEQAAYELAVRMFLASVDKECEEVLAYGAKFKPDNAVLVESH